MTIRCPINFHGVSRIEIDRVKTICPDTDSEFQTVSIFLYLEDGGDPESITLSTGTKGTLIVECKA